ncbi:MAG TPA: Holliday junction resolvase RuvX [Flavobacteriales bacterium]|jgi:putative Holliday junction resolvase|nr:Holliday junction resolvase RuvX [Flavobacteriales bacterium]
MPVIVALDFGMKRTGIAISDNLGLIATPFKTVPSEILLDELQIIMDQHQVNTLVIGQPRKLSGEYSDLEQNILKLIDYIASKFPELDICRQDERFTSSLSQYDLIRSGVGKKKRRDKTLLDKMSAALILQSFLDRQKH